MSELTNDAIEFRGELLNTPCVKEIILMCLEKDEGKTNAMCQIAVNKFTDTMSEQCGRFVAMGADKILFN
ncbi:MAG: hypothetical protein KAJ03_03800 [Gammaproteobacteria bacterium]|nr:hypothetical protein [Gammaproteobacteria bacterium]